MSKRVLWFSVLLWAVASLPAPANGKGSDFHPTHSICNIGPLTKTYGSTQWLVYSCDDQRSLAVVAAPGSRAAPFTFVFSRKQDGYVLHGYGARNEYVTAAAFQLAKLSGADIIALVAETKAKP